MPRTKLDGQKNGVAKMAAKGVKTRAPRVTLNGITGPVPASPLEAQHYKGRDMAKLAAKVAKGGMRIPELDLEWVRFKIVGTSPLLTSHFPDETLQQILDDQGGIPRIKMLRNPARDVMNACHICKGHRGTEHTEGNIYGFPAVGLKKAICTAMRRGKMAIQDKDKPSFDTGFYVHGPYDGLIPILDLAGNPAVFTPRQDRISMHSNGQDKANASCRPAFYPWSMTVTIRHSPIMVPIQQLVHATVLAGYFVGIGAWRHEKKGLFGLFNVEGQIETLDSDYVKEDYPVNVTDDFTPVPAPIKKKAKKAKKGGVAPEAVTEEDEEASDEQSETDE